MSTVESPLLPAIPGVRYVPAYLDGRTHDRLIAAVDGHAWVTSVDHRVQVYGYTYNHRARAAYRVGDLPPWAQDLAARLCEDGFVPRVPNQLVANDYQPGTGIFAHKDQAVFGDVVVSVSLGSTCVMRFTDDESGHAHDLLLEPTSLLVLTGEARWRWTHEIPARVSDTWGGRDYPRSRRVSLTFRVVPEASAAAAVL